MQLFDANLISSPHLYSLARTTRSKIVKPSSCNVICIMAHSTEGSHILMRQKVRAATRSVLSPRVQSGHGVFAADMPKSEAACQQASDKPVALMSVMREDLLVRRAECEICLR